MKHEGQRCKLCTMQLETPYLIVTEVQDNGSTIAGMFCDDKCLFAYLQKDKLTEVSE